MHHVALAPLMEAIGPLDEDILAVTALDTGWVVRLPDLDLQVEEDAAEGRHIATVAVSGPMAGRPDLLDALLRYNLMRRETGTCMALGPDGEIVLSADWRSDDATPHRLVEILQNVAAKARAWAQVAAQPAPEGANAFEPSLDMIRI